MCIPHQDDGQEIDTHVAVALGEPVRGRDPNKWKEPHCGVPEERWGIRCEVLFRDHRQPLLIRLCSHDPLLFETNRTDGFFAHYLCIAEIPLHWFWQSQH